MFWPRLEEEHAGNENGERWILQQCERVEVENFAESNAFWKNHAPSSQASGVRRGNQSDTTTTLEDLSVLAKLRANDE